METKDLLQRILKDPEAFGAAIGLTSELLTYSMADTLYNQVGLLPLIKLYNVVAFLWEVDMNDVAFELIEAMFDFAGIELPDAFADQMSDEEFAEMYVGNFLEDFLECLDGYCVEELGCCLTDLGGGYSDE